LVDDAEVRASLSEDARRTIIRRLSATNPETMGIERLEALKRQREWLNGLLATIFSKFAGQSLDSSTFDLLFLASPEGIDKQQLKNEMKNLYLDPKVHREYVNDRAFTDEFWFDLAIERSYLTGEETSYRPDGGVLVAASEQMVSFSAAKAATACASGRAARSKDERSAVRLVEGPPRHLWYPQVLGVSKPGVRPVPTYLLAGQAR
jgi:hypothetical protein